MGNSKNVCIVVLGDIGHSPRMQNHAVSLLEEGYQLDIVCYMESRPLNSICEADKERCRIHRMSPVPELRRRPLPAILQLIFKTLWQTMTLIISLLLMGRKPAVVLMQNPPGIPTLIVVYFLCLITRSKMVIDWHNYSFSILALKLARGQRHPLCRLMRWLEQFFGCRADAHFCVSDAMRQDLEKNWGIPNAIVLYDRPPEHFHPIGDSEKRKILSKLLSEYEDFIIPKNVEHKLQLMEEDDGKACLIKSLAVDTSSTPINHHPEEKDVAIVISSTSWTPDEDFSTLLRAFDDYDVKAQRATGTLPFLLCIITGKGPQKDEYREQIRNRHWQYIGIITPWLSSEDYASVLAAGHLGICLHFSSSGLDLPMKIVDMFGCGLPVCARAYPCLQELVHDGKNGFVFQDHLELSNLLSFYFDGFPLRGGRVQHQALFERNLKVFQALRWHPHWLDKVSPVFIVSDNLKERITEEIVISQMK